MQNLNKFEQYWFLFINIFFLIFYSNYIMGVCQGSRKPNQATSDPKIDKIFDIMPT